MKWEIEPVLPCNPFAVQLMMRYFFLEFDNVPKVCGCSTQC